MYRVLRRIETLAGLVMDYSEAMLLPFDEDHTNTTALQTTVADSAEADCCQPDARPPR